MIATAFQAWLAFLGPIEGGLNMNPSDPGNWTGGRPGDGFLRGTNGGISAASYPTLDIAALTQDQIDAIRKTDFWDAVHGDFLPAPIAFVVADAAYMSGPDRATRQMQQALGVTVDGDIGDQTTNAALTFPVTEFLIEFASVRLLFLTTLGIWPRDKGGWTRRLFRGVFAAASLQGVP
jgi:lysozyme family protein